MALKLLFVLVDLARLDVLCVVRYRRSICVAGGYLRPAADTGGFWVLMWESRFPVFVVVK